ncbi:MAG: KUP/HAK/KT family potassium transporter [Bacteroidetes bacterium]|nr:KUP/HAK/KT family potassium transporter [Bacteroidota bacterium]
MAKEHGAHSKVSMAGLLIAIGIIYGDIGTSPLYVMKAIVGHQVITPELALGGFSCIIWTLTLITTFKYLAIVLRADNKGEGGVFSLYALIRRKGKWLIFPAMIGGGTLLADGIITPSISVSSAIEGLELLNPGINTIPIVMVIISALFFVQQFGTAALGKGFGPIMLTWFGTLLTLGVFSMVHNPEVLAAVNPMYAIRLLSNHPNGYLLLGAVFLCITGAEAMYSDLGHCGRSNIRVGWGFVKIALLLNYAGQCGWLLRHSGETLNDRNPFFMLMPEWFVMPGIILATAAAVVASQAMITGSFTLISEATQLQLWPKGRIEYPTDQKGQLYVPGINLLLWLGCMAVILYFQRSERMEAAYGLAITITMLMTSVLLMVYLHMKRWPMPVIILLGLLFFGTELAFFGANLHKLTEGGWVSILIAGIVFAVMLVWRRGRRIKSHYTQLVDLHTYVPAIHELSEDASVSKYATHLVYLTSANAPHQVEWKVIYSIFRKQPKRADTYWFLHVEVCDEPHTKEFRVTTLEPGKIFRVDFKLGFRVQPRVSLLFRKVIEDMVAQGEVDILSRYESLRKQGQVGDFRFVVIDRFLSYENELPFFERIGMKTYFLLKKFTLSDEESFGLDTSSVAVEKVPFIIAPVKDFTLTRKDEVSAAT